MSNCGHTQVYATGPAQTLIGLRAAMHATRNPFDRHEAFSVRRMTGDQRLQGMLMYADLDDVEIRRGEGPRLSFCLGLAHDIDGFRFVGDLSASYPDLMFECAFSGEGDTASMVTAQFARGNRLHMASYPDGHLVVVSLTRRGGIVRTVHLHPRGLRGGNDDRWLDDQALEAIAGLPPVAPGWHQTAHEGELLLWHPSSRTMVRCQGEAPEVMHGVDDLGGYDHAEILTTDDCATRHPAIAAVVCSHRDRLAAALAAHHARMVSAGDAMVSEDEIAF